jgi:hypothetical protein
MASHRCLVIFAAALAVAPAFALAGCDFDLDFDPEIDESGCPAEVAITVTAAPVTLAPTAESVTVRGTAEIGGGVAIRRVTVEGVDATATSFNFAGWSAQLPAAALRTRVDDPAVDQKIEVAIVAVAACGTAPAKATASILVDAP